MLKIESKRLTMFPRSHKDADMQDVGGTNSEKHYERTQVMVRQQMHERQVLDNIYKGLLEAPITAIAQKKTADQSLHQGRGRESSCIAHHRRHG